MLKKKKTKTGKIKPRVRFNTIIPVFGPGTRFGEKSGDGTPLTTAAAAAYLVRLRRRYLVSRVFVRRINTRRPTSTNTRVYIIRPVIFFISPPSLRRSRVHNVCIHTRCVVNTAAVWKSGVWQKTICVRV